MQLAEKCIDCESANAQSDRTECNSAQRQPQSAKGAEDDFLRNKSSDEISKSSTLQKEMWPSSVLPTSVTPMAVPSLPSMPQSVSIAPPTLSAYPQPTGYWMMPVEIPQPNSAATSIANLNMSMQTNPGNYNFANSTIPMSNYPQTSIANTTVPMSNIGANYSNANPLMTMTKHHATSVANSAVPINNNPATSFANSIMPMSSNPGRTIANAVMPIYHNSAKPAANQTVSMSTSAANSVMPMTNNVALNMPMSASEPYYRAAPMNNIYTVPHQQNANPKAQRDCTIPTIGCRNMELLANTNQLCRNDHFVQYVQGPKLYYDHSIRQWSLRKKIARWDCMKCVPAGVNDWRNMRVTVQEIWGLPKHGYCLARASSNANLGNIMCHIFDAHPHAFVRWEVEKSRIVRNNSDEDFTNMTDININDSLQGTLLMEWRNKKQKWRVGLYGWRRMGDPIHYAKIKAKDD